MKLGSALLVSPVVRPLLAWAGTEKLKNWAGNVEYGTEELYSANSLDEVRGFVRKHNQLKVLGTHTDDESEREAALALERAIWLNC